ncbi:MAG: hypothetical protein IID51_14015 [Proteobacteria bacterium]|nr:hypothetical protein [Pseudomonadota bacterium]
MSAARVQRDATPAGDPHQRLLLGGDGRCVMPDQGYCPRPAIDDRVAGFQGLVRA